ncbi:ribokinase [Corynebacterium pyruviciproducens ATCC BAA-1742]|uniref:Ribokinase n=1 Tax=Corynebacterium pyruviciproducens ATCC BAA-1742 TaxID=1125779 RepID=S2Z393_9CORY|nr:ribokinase [Corynebacterium pyruviciproducens]EPD68670.1 ribokinase [Corynebacterium pyruviciproducens ATCC BAA-1742]MDK6566888.1 ribokinase [Corynebacterium pyruviciproducens]
MSKGRVFVVGSANLDRFLYVDAFVRAGETISSTSSKEAVGGKGLNQAVAAARAGASTWMVGNLGSDGAAMTITEAIAGEENLHRDFLTSQTGPGDEPGTPTGQAMIQISKDGDNAIVLIAGANATITTEHVTEALESLTSADVVVCQREIPDPVTGHALALAKEKGATTVLNLAPATADTSLLAHVDLLIVNETEAATLLGSTPTAPEPETALAGAIHRRFGLSTILTAGPAGAYIAAGGETTHIPAMNCDVADTTGAGDAFVGATVALLAEGADLTRAASYGIAAATAACSAPGAQGYTQRRQDFDVLLASNPPQDQ